MAFGFYKIYDWISMGFFFFCLKYVCVYRAIFRFIYGRAYDLAFQFSNKCREMVYRIQVKILISNVIENST